jgi:hypothetical protein
MVNKITDCERNVSQYADLIKGVLRGGKSASQRVQADDSTA